MAEVTFPMEFQKANQAYEKWARARVPLISADLQTKYRRMTDGVFPFLRATFYRWVQIWPRVCAEMTTAPVLLAIGDLHVENFGTWRDSEGRLIWGVNDFDEAFQAPYTSDLVRLATSAVLAIGESNLSCAPKTACDAILTGYRESLETGGRPFVLSEHHRWLRDLAIGDLRDPTRYWEKLDALPKARQRLPAAVATLLEKALPEPGLPFQIVHRQAGLGSLGRRRFTLLADWRGGRIAREAKELVTSAWRWQAAGREDPGICCQEIIDQAVRVPDPFARIQGTWLLRRLAPDCSRIELSTLPKPEDELRLLHAMGWETANIHLGTKSAVRKVLDDLKQRPDKWLRRAAEIMAQATDDDWTAWRKREKP